MRNRWRIWWTYRVAPHVGVHRGRPALVAEHQGATANWSPTAELARVEDREPEETEAEAAEREAQELLRHREEVKRAAEEDVHAEWSAELDPKLGPLFAAVDEACRVVLDELGLTEAEADQLLARYRNAAVQTGEWPIMRAEVSA